MDTKQKSTKIDWDSLTKDWYCEKCGNLITVGGRRYVGYHRSTGKRTYRYIYICTGGRWWNNYHRGHFCPNDTSIFYEGNAGKDIPAESLVND